MNNTQNYNLNDDTESSSNDLSYYSQVQSENSEIEQIANELMYLTYDQLCQKYNTRILPDKVLGKSPISYSTVIGYILMLKHLFILNFVPAKNIFQISNDKKNAIVELIARAEPQNTPQVIDQRLKVIDPTFSIPEDFAVEKYQTRARELYNANSNIRNIVADGLVSDYLTDVMHFMRFSNSDLQNYINDINNISEKVAQEYDKLLKNQPIDEQIFENIFPLLVKAGRPSLFIQEAKDDKNLGDLTEIIIKINTALQIVDKLKAKNINSDVTTDYLKEEIKNYLLNDLNI